MTHPIVKKIVDFAGRLDYENGPASFDEVMPQGDLGEIVDAITEHLSVEYEPFGFGWTEAGESKGYEWRMEDDDYAVTLEIWTDDSMMSLNVFVC